MIQLVLLFTLATLPPAIQKGSAGAGAAAVRPRVLLETLAGDVEERPLTGFRLDDPRHDGFHFVRFEGLASQAQGSSGARAGLARVELLGGDGLSGRVSGGQDDGLEIEIVGGARLAVSIDEIVSVRFPTRQGDGAESLYVPAERGDRLYRKSGGGADRVDGLFNAFDSNGVRFESRLGEKLYPWDEVVALFIEPLESEPGASVQDEGEHPPVVVDLHGASRLRGALLGLDERGCRLKTDGNPELFLPAAAILEIAVNDGSFRYLSELEPDQAGPVSPYGDELGMVWPHRMDRAQSGDPLQAGGRVFSRGIGVHAPSRLTWILDGSFAELRAQVAIDDQVLVRSHRGSVIFRVRLDGEVVFESSIVRGGDPALRVTPISLEGKKELVLEVDPSTDLHVADRADWLRPILVRRL